MARRGVEVVVQLLHVLAVVAFGAGEPKQPLLEDRVATVPQRNGQAQPLAVVAEPADAVLTPAVRAAAGVVVREVIPRRAVRAVVLAHGSPLPLAQVGPPSAPVGAAAA